MAVHAAAERDSQQLLQQLGIDSLPIDPIRIAHLLGANVWTSDLSGDIAGVLVKRKDETPVVYLNSSDAVVRQRFTAAHEVGHLFKRALDGQADAPINYVDYRDNLSSRGTSAAEIYANGFAAALLMPADKVRALWREYQDVSRMANRFKVSTEAMRHRLTNLNVI